MTETTLEEIKDRRAAVIFNTVQAGVRLRALQQEYPAAEFSGICREIGCADTEARRYIRLAEAYLDRVSKGMGPAAALDELLYSDLFQTVSFEAADQLEQRLENK